MSQSPIQRFIGELRRRHVPQTAAIYLVAAWAAIEFADVVVPNLNGPQWVVTAVIVAALVGFPVMLVVAWVFEWGPEGIHRTEAETAAVGERGSPTGPRSQPWMAAVAVLVVGIGSAIAVTVVLGSGGPEEAGAPPPDTTEAQQPRSTTVRRPGEFRGVPPAPSPPDMEGYGGAIAESVRSELLRTWGELEALDSLDLGGLAEMGRRMAVEWGQGIVIEEPREWGRPGGREPVELSEGDTLTVAGVALDTAGVAAVTVDGETVAEADPPDPTLPFTATLVGTGSAGTRTVVIAIRTADGRELRRELRLSQLPGGTP